MTGIRSSQISLLENLFDTRHHLTMNTMDVHRQSSSRIGLTSSETQKSSKIVVNYKGTPLRDVTL